VRCICGYVEQQLSWQQLRLPEKTAVMCTHASACNCVHGLHGCNMCHAAAQLTMMCPHRVFANCLPAIICNLEAALLLHPFLIDRLCMKGTECHSFKQLLDCSAVKLKCCCFRNSTINFNASCHQWCAILQFGAFAFKCRCLSCFDS
jgi:hypothetical protein